MEAESLAKKASASKSRCVGTAEPFVAATGDGIHRCIRDIKHASTERLRRIKNKQSSSTSTNAPDAGNIAGISSEGVDPGSAKQSVFRESSRSSSPR